jgi:hypothetical protein
MPVNGSGSFSRPDYFAGGKITPVAENRSWLSSKMSKIFGEIKNSFYFYLNSTSRSSSI